MKIIKKLLTYVFIDDVLKSDIEFFKQISIFSNLSDHSLAKIAVIIFKKSYIAGEQVYKDGQEANVLYIVKNGSIHISNGKDEQIIETGDFFGEISLIGKSRHNSIALASKDSELYLMYKVKFDDMVASNPKAGLKIMKNMAAMFETRLRCSANAEPLR